MPVVTPNKYESRGPWQLTKRAMQRLQDVLDTVSEVLSHENEQEEEQVFLQLRNEKNLKSMSDDDLRVSARRTRGNRPLRHKVVLGLSKGNSITGETVPEVLQNVSMRGLKAESLFCTIKVNSLEFEISVAKYRDDSLRYTFAGIGEDGKQKILQSVENWQDEFQPNQVVLIWDRLRFSLLMGAAAVNIILSAITYFTSPLNSYKEDLKREIRKDLESAGSIDLQLETVKIFKLVSDFVPKDYTPPFTTGYLQFHAFFLVFSFFVLTSPRTTIEFGSSAKWIQIWKGWYWLVFVFLPGSIILPLLLSKVGG